MITWSQNDEVTVLEFYSNLGSMSHNRYFAMALSHDDKMGDTLVIGSVSVNGKVGAELSWNSGKIEAGPPIAGAETILYKLNR